jgi:phosphoadenosine phosphosulfate reductase
MNTKIQESIDFIKEYAPIAEKYGGYSVMFSGGKDSQVMLDLFKKAGVNYKAYYNVTTNDPPENVYFIRKNYPEVIFNHPKYTFLQLIEKKGILPTKQKRFCCSELKEKTGKGFVAIGVRKEESNTRKNYIPIAFNNYKPFDIKRIRKNRKVHFRPILYWREDEIWEYIEENGIPINPCYDNYRRVGCMLCPYASRIERVRTFEKYPKLRKNLINTIQKCKENGKFKRFKDPDEVLDWWLSKLSIDDYFDQKRQLRLFD